MDAAPCSPARVGGSEVQLIDETRLTPRQFDAPEQNSISTGERLHKYIMSPKAVMSFLRYRLLKPATSPEIDNDVALRLGAANQCGMPTFTAVVLASRFLLRHAPTGLSCSARAFDREISLQTRETAAFVGVRRSRLRRACQQ
jgi:hypothetical protein